MSSLAAIAGIGFIASFTLCGMIRRHLLARSLLDRPNARSLHTVPTPRGGGLGIVLVVLGGISVMVYAGRLDPMAAVALAGGGALVAWIGWLDDRRDLPVALRLGVHTVASVWLVCWLGGMPLLTVGAHRLSLGLAGGVLAVLATVWAINLYNFMDGIDGLAAGEAGWVGLVAALLLARSSPGLAGVSVLVSAAAAGFLPWNWALARTFMGDVGSGFLGFIFAGLAVASENAQALPALVWLLLLSVFFADSTITLVRRMVRGDRWYAPHTTHAYQRLVQAGWPHVGVTLAVMGLDVGLGAMAWRAAHDPELLVPFLAAASLSLCFLYLLVERRCPMPARHRSEPGQEAEVRRDIKTRAGGTDGPV
jgi:glycosyltransferase WbpL